MAYGNGASSSLGSLLRFIEEQKAQTPIIPPGTETGSPLRTGVQNPLLQPEAQDTSRVVSLKPEGVATQPGGAQTPVAPSQEGMQLLPNPVVLPPTPGEGSPSPGPSGQPGNQGGQPSVQGAQNRSPSAPTPTSVRSTPQVLGIGTKIAPSGVNLYTSSGGIIPGLSKSQPMVGTPQTTPTPAPQPGQTPAGGWMNNIQRAIYDRLFKPFGGKAYA